MRLRPETLRVVLGSALMVLGLVPGLFQRVQEEIRNFYESASSTSMFCGPPNVAAASKRPNSPGFGLVALRDLLGIGVGADVGTEAGHEFGHASYMMQVG